MKISEALEFADVNRQGLEYLLMRDGELFFENERYSWQTDDGVIPDLDVNYMVEVGIMKIEGESKISVFMPVYQLVVDSSDIRSCFEAGTDFENISDVDNQLLKILNRGFGIRDFIKAPGIRFSMNDGYF